MQHPDEGTIHAWLDDALPPDEGARIEAHVAACAPCAAAVAEARGLIAASSRILTALDDVPGRVLPAMPRAGAAAPPLTQAAAPRSDVLPHRASARRPFRVTPGLAAAAALLLVLGVGSSVMMRGDGSIATREMASSAMAPAAADVAVPEAAADAGAFAAPDAGASAAPDAGRPLAVAAPPTSAARVATPGTGARASEQDVANAPSIAAAAPPPSDRSAAPAAAPQRVAAMRDAAPANDASALAAADERARRDASARADGIPSAARRAEAAISLDAAAREQRVAKAAVAPSTTGAAAGAAAGAQSAAEPAAEPAAALAGCFELVAAPWRRDGAPSRFRLTAERAGDGYLARALPSNDAGRWTLAPDGAIAIALPGWPSGTRLVRGAAGDELRGDGVLARRTGC